MAKSMVEKYEQILSADPGSMVFVELAKALLDHGEALRAIQICQAGLQHHPESVVGRVLWGKALISCGRPAEAMAQFDEAIAIDRDNPYAYNLIGEVLLNKGLHRSALPILKKAVALQPNDARVRGWLDQTTRALNGEKEPAPQVTAPGAASPAAAVPVLASVASSSEATVVEPRPGPSRTAEPKPVTTPARPIATARAAPPQPQPEAIPALSELFKPEPEAQPANTVRAAPPARPAQPSATNVVRPLGPSEPPARASDLTADLPPGPTSVPIVPPMAISPAMAAEPTQPLSAALLARSNEATRTDGEALPPALVPAPAPNGVQAREAALTQPPPELSLGPDEQVRMERPRAEEAPLPPELESSTVPEPSQDATAPGTPLALGRGADETVDLPPAGPAATPVVPPLHKPPESAPRAARPGNPPPLASRPKLAAAPAGGPPPIPNRTHSGNALLADLPSLAAPLTPSLELPKVELSSQAAEAIAKEYERELREKLAAAQSAPPSFWSQHGLKLGLGGLALALGLVGFGVFRYAKRHYANLPDLRAKAHAALEKDTSSAYDASLAALSDILEASPGDAEAEALTAYVHALLYREHGQKPAEREAVLAALNHTEVTQSQPELAAAARYYLAADDAEAREAAKPLAIGKGAEAHEITGKLLLESDPRKALEQFQESLKAQSGHVRTYVALGDYYLQSGEPANAASMFTSAKTISDHHPGALLGLTAARLAQGKELDEASADLAVLEKEAAQLGPESRARLDILAGRLLAAKGQGAQAVERLNAGLDHAPAQAVDFHIALADVYALQGAYDRTLSELQQAQKAKAGGDKDLALVDLIARAQLAMGRPQEALKLTDKLDDRRLHLTRGIALYQQGSYEGARRELYLTRRDKSMPTEAAIYLARTEIAAGRKEDARPAIEAIFKAGKLSPKAQVARGELALASGDREQAMKAFTAAAEDAREYEAPYLLGKLLLADGKPAEAQKPLTQAVERNHFAGDAHLALGRTLLALGSAKEARPHLQSFVKDHPGDPVALAALARTSLALGQLAEARTLARQATERPGRDPEVLWTRTQVDLAAGEGPAVLRDLARRAKALRSADAWCDVADAALDLDDAKMAFGAYTVALKTEHTLPRARVGLAVADAALHGKAAAAGLSALVAPANKLPPLLQARALAALSRVSSGAEAKAHADEAVAASDGSAAAHLALGLALGKAPEAAGELARAATLEPGWAEAQVLLAEALVAQGDKPRAIQAAEAGRRIVGKGPLADRARVISGASDEPAPTRRAAKSGGKKRRK